MVYTLRWDAVEDLDLYNYEVRRGGNNWETSTFFWQGIATSLEIPTPTTTTTYWIKAVDTSGNYSETAASLEFIVNLPLAPAVNFNVVQNLVTLSWTTTTQPNSLPISHYLVYRLSAVSSNTSPPPGAEVFRTNETRITLTALAAGIYTYWVVVVDSGGNQSPATRIIIESQNASDYREFINIRSSFLGTVSNFLRVPETVVSPLIDTYEFIDNVLNFDFPDTQELIGPLTNIWAGNVDTWATVDSILNIEFTVATTATYTETFDLQSTQSTGQIQFSLTSIWEAGGTSVTLTPTISTSTDNATWTTYPNNYQVFATNFRYVRLSVTANGDGLSLVRFTNLQLIIGNQAYNDSGIATATSTDINGTLVNFNLSFRRIRSITLTPISTTTVISVYDYSSVNNPNGFRVYLYNTMGARLSGNFSWSATGEL